MNNNKINKLATIFAKLATEEEVSHHNRERQDLISGGKIIAYHGGRSFDGNFSIDMIGSGESIGILGPGIYFITNKEAAKRYCKYVKSSTLYTVEIDASGIYGSSSGLPHHLREGLKELKEQIGREHGKWDESRGRYRLPNADNFKYGQGFIGEITKLFGAAEAHNLLKGIGITGVYVGLPIGVEIAIFDPSIITIIEREECE